MTSPTTSKRMLAAYRQRAGSLPRFLSTQFQAPAGNFHSSEEVEIDIMRDTEEVSVAITDLNSGYRMNRADLYTNKSFIPPVHKEAVVLNSFDLLKRAFGSNPFEEVGFRAKLSVKLMDSFAKIDRKIRRAIELQASQVLQTATATLTDSDGNTVYAIDYKGKTAHFPTSAVPWATATGKQKLEHLESLIDTIRDNGLSDPDMLIAGDTAIESLISDSYIQDRLDTRRISLGSIGMFQDSPGGGKYVGKLQIGSYLMELWTYNGRYKHPQTGTITKYLDGGKIIVRSKGSRLDATFGAVPNIGEILGVQGDSVMGRLPEMPRAFLGAGAALYPNAWVTPNGEQMYAGLAARPLMIPTDIDSFGCLDTQL